MSELGCKSVESTFEVANTARGKEGIVISIYTYMNNGVMVRVGQ